MWRRGAPPTPSPPPPRPVDGAEGDRGRIGARAPGFPSFEPNAPIPVEDEVSRILCRVACDTDLITPVPADVSESDRRRVVAIAPGVAALDCSVRHEPSLGSSRRGVP